MKAYDMYVPGVDNFLPGDVSFTELQNAINDRRVLRWEDQVGPMIDSNLVSVAEVRKLFRRAETLKEYLAEHEARAATGTA